MSNLIKNSIDTVLKQKYLSYAISTIISRSLPDVRDGLKPVHRRIIYSMYLLKLFHGSSFKKSARIVGDTMGKFHPHGDQAIYDSLVRLAQNFSSRIPLIEGQGNFGNIDGDNAAAMRYTEARLEKVTNYFFDGLEEKAVNFVENYDGQNFEPSVLPTKLPNILINGATGIAVGMATNIPPHNLNELNNTIIKIIKNPKVKLNQLLNEFQGPDFPTGAEVILSNKDKKEIYKKGRGNFIIRSKWEKEILKNGIYQIVIKEIPYQINKTRLIEQLANLINQKKLPLDDVWDESDKNIRIILKPKNRNIDSDKLMELCFKLSDLSTKFSCNFNVLEKGSIPKQMGLIEILNNFINHRRDVIKRKSIYRKKIIEERLIVLAGLLIAYKYLDNIIRIIRKSNDPKKEIIKKYKLKDKQAEAILNMRLGALRKLDEVKTIQEIKSLKNEKAYLSKLINNKKVLNSYIIDDINKLNIEIDDKNVLRKTVIIKENNDAISDVSVEEFQEIEKMTFVSYSDYTVKVYKGHIDLNKIKSDNKIKTSFHFLSNSKLLFFVSSGRVYTVDPKILPSGKSNPKNFTIFIDVMHREKLINVMTFKNDKKCIVASKLGKGFIINISESLSTQRKGKQFFNLKNNDELIKVTNFSKKFIACVSTNQKMLIFKVNDLPNLSKGSGVVLQKFKEKYFLSDIHSFDSNEGLKWVFGSKISSLTDFKFWIGKRAQVGKKIPKKFNKNLKFFDE